MMASIWSIENVFSPTMLAWARKAGGTIDRASSLLSTSTIIHAWCSPSMQPQSAFLRKWEPLVRKTVTTRAQAS